MTKLACIGFLSLIAGLALLSVVDWRIALGATFLIIGQMLGEEIKQNYE